MGWFCTREGRGTVPWPNYLIKRLSDRRLIKCPKGATKWVITGGHFVDSQSRPFSDWNSQHDPKKSAQAIEKLCDVLDPTIPLD